MGKSALRNKNEPRRVVLILPRVGYRNPEAGQRMRRNRSLSYQSSRYNCTSTNLFGVV